MSQNNELVHSSVLRRFLFAAQQKSVADQRFNYDLSIWLLNGTQVLVEASYEDSSENILQVRSQFFCRFFKLYYHYFLIGTRIPESLRSTKSSSRISSVFFFIRDGYQ